MASTYNKEWNNLSIEEKRDVIRVALKNGIRELPDIKAKYNEFAGGGSFYQKHRARWNNYLLRHGVPEQQAAKLSTFFAAQDALESGHGTSDAAKGKNNFGGMQYLDKKSNKMVNISYPSVDAYMDAKWKMMQNRFGRALNANSIQEYSNLLNDPRYHGKGYMYALYEGYRDGKPLDVAKQTQHMNNYTKILMDIAGEKGFKGAPVPAGQAGEAPASIARPENPYTQYTPAEPFFNQNRTFVRPEDVRKAQEENALRMAESQNAAMQQERKQSVDSFNTLMGLLHTPNNGNSGILGTIATLASLNKNNRFDTGGVKQQPRQYIYDVLPSLFAKDGVKITVSSGFRPGAKTVEGKPSRHSLKQAADIVGDFKAIRRVLDDPNSYTSRWLLANGYGYLDETSATGTTKFWHDHKRDHSHYHIGMDSGIVSKYASMMNGRVQNPLPAQQNIVEQPIELAQTPDIPFTPSNPQAFFGVHPAQQQSVYDYVTTPTVEQPVYDPMVEEKNDVLSNLSKLNAIMQLTSPSNSGNNNFLNTVGLLANMSAEGGKIHIKPENRGKFTALKKRTGHSATWFKEHGTPAQRKMATFALNARHWKHGLGGNLYEEGGPEKKWKALDNIDFVAIPDTSFTRDKTGVGSIEYFDSRYPEGITYPNGYHREHPLPGKDVILYNPNDNDKQDIRLDALHIMPKDATYDTLYSQYLDEIYTGQAGDLAWKGVKKWEDDAKKYGKNNIDTKNQYIRNEADGLLRNSLIEGDSDYRKQKGYSASKSDAVKEFPTLVPYVDAIQNYLVTGERPANILQEVTITGKKRRGKKHADGGNLFSGEEKGSQQMKGREGAARSYTIDGITYGAPYYNYDEPGRPLYRNATLPEIVITPPDWNFEREKEKALIRKRRNSKYGYIPETPGMKVYDATKKSKVRKAADKVLDFLGFTESDQQRMLSDLQYLGLAAEGGENGTTYGIVAPGVLNGTPVGKGVNTGVEALSKKAAVENLAPTQRIFKFLGKDVPAEKASEWVKPEGVSEAKAARWSMRHQIVRDNPLIADLRAQGVDVEKIGLDDLKKLQELRKQAIKDAFESSGGRYAITDATSGAKLYGENVGAELQTYKGKPAEPGAIGSLNFENMPLDKYLEQNWVRYDREGAVPVLNPELYEGLKVPGMIQNYARDYGVKGVSKDLYSASLFDMAERGTGKGIASGTVLLSPEKTTRVVSPNNFNLVEISPNAGWHKYTMETLDGTPAASWQEGPITGITGTTTPIQFPVKNGSLFDVSIIDNNGIMHIDPTIGSSVRKALGGHIYNGTSEDTQQMNTPRYRKLLDAEIKEELSDNDVMELPLAAELSDVRVTGKKKRNVLSQIKEKWVKNDKGEEVPTYWGYNPDTKQLEQLYRLEDGKSADESIFFTPDGGWSYNVPQAAEMRKAHEQWVKNGGNASDFDKWMLGYLGFGLTPIALPEIAAGVGTALANPYVDAGLTSYFGAHGLNHAINEGIDGWGDAAMTALEVAPLGRLVKPMWNAAKSTRNFIPTPESNMSGVRYAYDRNPELANIGTLEDYNDYLKTVFPESKVKDINYHMGPKGLQELKPSTGEVYNTNPDARGIYVTPDKSYAQKLRKYTTSRLENPSFFTYIKRNLTPGGWDKANEAFTDIYPVMVDTKNPLLTKGDWTWGIKDKKYQSLMDDYDAIVNSGPKWYQNVNSMPETIVPKTEQSLILGSDADVAGFRRFMSNPQITAENTASMAPKVNWDADNWFKTISGRNSYSAEEAAELASHVPEYRAIEQRLFDEGKLAVDSNGNIVVVGSEMSPQEYIMRQSEAFQKMNPEHHYVGVSKKLRDTFENEARDPATRNRYDVWTDRKSPKNVEEYAISQQGGYTNASQIEKVENQMSIREENHELHKEQLKWKLEHGKISQETYDRDLASLEDNYSIKQKEDGEELKVLRQQEALDPLNGGKVFDVTYPRNAAEAPVIDAEGNHWHSIPYLTVQRDAPVLTSHYQPYDPVNTTVQTDQLVTASRRHGYGVTHIDNVKDTYDGTMLNETIIGRGTPVKSVLGNTGTFDVEGANKWKLYRSLLPPFLGLGAVEALYGKQE